MEVRGFGDSHPNAEGNCCYFKLSSNISHKKIFAGLMLYKHLDHYFVFLFVFVIVARIKFWVLNIKKNILTTDIQYSALDHLRLNEANFLLESL